MLTLLKYNWVSKVSDLFGPECEWSGSGGFRSGSGVEWEIFFDLGSGVECGVRLLEWEWSGVDFARSVPALS